MANVEPLDGVATEAFDFTVEPVNMTSMEIVETVDDSVITGALAARCN